MGKLKKISKYRPSILQGKLEFSGVPRSITVASEQPYESALIRVLMIALVVLACAYMYFVGASILNIVARKEAGSETTRLQSAIASLEREYFALSHAVDESIASNMGLTVIERTQYVYKPGTAVAATIPANGI